MTEEVFVYQLLDWGGTVEEERPMTEIEAKELNQQLWEKEPRFLLWSKTNKVFKDNGE